MNRQPQDSHESDVTSWIIIAIAFVFFWPMGIVLLLRKLNIIPAFKQSGTTRGVSVVQKRFDRYKTITEGRDSMPIEYIASAAGVAYDTARRDIERILDTLTKGFAQQLDQLFSSDVLDISSDIDVLESMMKKDGLSDDDSGFQSMGSC